MRSMIVGIGLAALVGGAFGTAALAATSKMGCEIGKEVWNASAGKCEPGSPAKKSAKSSAKKKAPEKK